MARSKNNTRTAKYETLHQVALLLRPDQIDFLNMLQRETTAQRQDLGRHPDREPITKNTYIRALVDILNLKYKKLDIKGITNEEDLVKRLKKIFK